jgi:hypothetical protein
MAHWGAAGPKTNKPTVTFAPSVLFVILNHIFSKRDPKIVKSQAPQHLDPPPDGRIKKYVVKVWKGEATDYSEHGNIPGVLLRREISSLVRRL